MNKLLVFPCMVLVNLNLSYAQLVPSVANLQGIWISEYENIKQIKIFKSNTYFELYYMGKSNTVDATTTIPFGYFGFSTSGAEPKKISELKQEGTFIRFYSSLNQEYDNKGNLLGPDLSCPITINEDFDGEKEPKVMYLYFRGTPDGYGKVTKVPDHVLLLLKKNKADWRKYSNFVEMKQKPISSKKAIIYSLPNIATKMYLLKNDTIEVLEQKNDWVRMNFYGKKLISGWIKKADVKIE